MGVVASGPEHNRRPRVPRPLPPRNDSSLQSDRLTARPTDRLSPPFTHGLLPSRPVLGPAPRGQLRAPYPTFPPRAHLLGLNRVLDPLTAAGSHPLVLHTR